MRIKNKTLQVTLEHDIVVGEGAITATVEHHVFIFENKEGKIDYDLDFSDVKNIRFMGIVIEDGYKHYEKFVKGMNEIGIDASKLFNDAAAKVVTDNDISELKQIYIDGVRSSRHSFNFTGPR